MGFAVTCKSCQARFLLNDDLLKRRVAGRVVTVRCRQCQGTIEVDASNVDPVTLTESMRPDALEEILAPAKPAMPKPAPPPRPPAKSTLMGIGAARPAGAKELVALSPGLLGVETKPRPAPPMSSHGFPEPPPPPSGGVVEELNSSDWKISEPPPALRRASANETTIFDAAPPSAPENLDDFVESIPSSVPPAEEDPTPSSSGTPSLQHLAHHDQKPGGARKQDDFFLNMTAALNGGVAPEMSAPTIDVSNLGAPQSSPPGAGVDVPLKGGQTLPLFAMGDPASALLNTPAPKSVPPQSATSACQSDAPSSAPRSRGPDSPRERKNVVAPVEKKAKADASPPSRLAGPLLLALAAAAGFLIWKSGAGGHAAPEPTPDVPATPEAVARPEPAKVAEPTPSLVSPPATSAAATPASAPTDGATKPQPGSAAAATHTASDKATSTTTPAATPSAAPAKPATPLTEAKPEAAAAAATPAAPKEEPAAAPAEATPPAEPAGPFDRAAAAAALNAAAAQASACRKEGDPSGIAAVTITFAPSGRVTSANISGPPFAGTPTGGCIASTLRKARIPAFDGDRVTVSKTITVQ